MFDVDEDELIEKEYQEFMKQRDKFSCQHCGRKDCKLVAHHIIAYRFTGDDSADNLITLCHKCHRKIHGKEKTERYKKHKTYH